MKIRGKAMAFFILSILVTAAFSIYFAKISAPALKISDFSLTIISIMTSAALLMLALCSFFFSKTITKPLDELNKYVVEIGKGNLNIKTSLLQKNDEIGDLARSIELMSGELKRLNEVNEQHSQKLETEIKGKTSELNSKVEELEKSKMATLNIMEDIEFANRELIAAQEQLKQNVTELKTLDYQKDQFISIAAHELKTPLTSIKGFSDLLRKKEVSGNDSLREKYLEIIHNDTKRLATMITNILELSRMDLGTMKISLQQISAKELFAEIRDQMGIIIKEKGIESDYVIGDNIPPIWMDKDKIIQVISNLINNAVHYTEKGKISVKVKRQENSALFSVSDTGIGIPKEHFGKLFTRFYQVDNPLTRKIGGSGLGLSISKGFVEAMGGKIWFESEIGKGTTFYFTLPLERTKTEDVQIVKK